ncbi:MAG: S-adenosylmethionine:tRNA ribosyltransferase-isomerase [Flavitalea sp.]
MKDLSIDDYTYSLPENRIAEFPLVERDLSKLLIYKDKQISESTYRNIAEQLPEDSLIVFNDSRVIEARLVFIKDTGARIEIFCLEPDPSYRGLQRALQQTGSVQWICLIGGASKWKNGQILELPFTHEGKTYVLKAAYMQKEADAFLIELSWNNDELTFAEILHYAGNMPLPPYIKRQADTADSERYQTIYANEPGSVAAPTAGLHFTERVMDSLREKKIEREYVTLHVGAGTFKPVKAATMQEHEMHAEYIDVKLETLEKLVDYAERITIAVGTTSMRTLESIYWLGAKILLYPQMSDAELSVSQWFAFDHATTRITITDALSALKNWMLERNISVLITKTQLLIGPGYRFRVVNALVTNFHQPKSTLLLLVAALAGEEWKQIYEYALGNDFRFLSYGDGCLIFGAKP